MPVSISILCVGNELLDGRIKDTNSSWIGNELRKHGLSLNEISTCSDSTTVISSNILRLLNNSDVVIVSGGLGPTSDDLTREGVADALKVKVVEDQSSKEHVERYFAVRNRPINHTNMRQAFLPEGANYINNPIGSAPGFLASSIVDGKNKFIFALPGVPQEFTRMWTESVFPKIFASFPLKEEYFEEGFRVFGLPESEIGARIEAEDISKDVNICYRVIYPEIEVLIRGSDQKTIIDATLKCKEAITSEFIIAPDPNIGLDQLVMDLCISRGLTLSVAESCTGGMLGSILTSISGSSKFFIGGVQSYSNEIKEKVLGVPLDIIKEHGAVSEKVATWMATGAREKLGSKLAVSITGIAGPDGGTIEKPVGTFYIGISTEKRSQAYHFFMPTFRERIRRYACYCAMDLIRREILGIDLTQTGR